MAGEGISGAVMRMLSTQTTMTNHIAHRLSLHSPQAPTRPSTPTARGKKTAAVGFPSKMTDWAGTKLVRLRSASKIMAVITGSGWGSMYGASYRNLHTVASPWCHPKKLGALPGLYSPECVEEEFCELRIDGVLRSCAKNSFRIHRPL